MRFTLRWRISWYLAALSVVVVFTSRPNAVGVGIICGEREKLCHGLDIGSVAFWSWESLILLNPFYLSDSANPLTLKSYMLKLFVIAAFVVMSILRAE